MSEKRVFGVMNGLRGVAALLVVVFHWSFRDLLHLEHAYIVVDLFFVLSGFVIAYSYDGRLLGRLSAADFFILRMIRLYPLYFFGTFISFVLIFVSIVVNGRLIESKSGLLDSVPFALLMLPSPPGASDLAKSYLYPLNNPAWSLFFELSVNIAYAVTIRWWTLKNLTILVACVGTVLVGHLVYTGDLYGDGGINWASFHMGFIRVLYSFPFGVLIYRLYQKGFVLPSVPAAFIVAALPLLLMLPASIVVPFNVLIALPALVALAANSAPTGAFGTLCNALGAASYAVYAVHDPLHGIISQAINKVGLASGQIWADAILIVIIVPVGLLLDRFYDGPVRRLLSQQKRLSIKGR